MDKLILAIDAEIRKLTSARALLQNGNGQNKKPTESHAQPSARSIAQRKRWAKQKAKRG